VRARTPLRRPKGASARWRTPKTASRRPGLWLDGTSQGPRLAGTSLPTGRQAETGHQGRLRRACRAAPSDESSTAVSVAQHFAEAGPSPAFGEAASYPNYSDNPRQPIFNAESKRDGGGT
jgi:hypothetical protein